jgi:hypothetical protein
MQPDIKRQERQGKPLLTDLTGKEINYRWWDE